jgi:hypothetical protein
MSLHIVSHVQECLPINEPRDRRNTAHSSLPRFSRRLLQPRLDSINRRIAQWTHSTRDKTNKHRFITWKIRFAVVLLEHLSELRVCREVDSLV